MQGEDEMQPHAEDPISKALPPKGEYLSSKHPCCLQLRQRQGHTGKGTNPEETQEAYTQEKMRDKGRNKGMRASAEGPGDQEWQWIAELAARGSMGGGREGQCWLQQATLPFQQQQQARDETWALLKTQLGADGASDSRRTKVKRSLLLQVV
ncbi:hypothetical protein P7K49_018278 [Saguinus oedipus]|uniref:Uncharacterized protein n=1 Tax=Saguinus oedipus TaxID=9490 RepID=A0ABQ9V7P3_SAGOE|nr:hypothetical protein P7K49_018278 [Saguinus oedipus]